MKMRYLGFGSLMIFLALAISGCLKDKTNLDYSEKEVITIENIDGSYNAISLQDVVKISPVVSSNKPNADFTYSWGIYETAVQGSVPKLQNLTDTKDLEYLVDKSAKTWMLVFKATNQTTGYSAIREIALNVSTSYTRGWYVLQDDGANSDLDLFLTPDTIVPSGQPITDVYSKVNGEKIPGQAKFINFLSAYKSKVTGKLGNTRVFLITAESGLAVLNVNDLQTIRTADNITYGALPVVKPEVFFFGSSYGYYLINNGRLMTISNIVSNDGTFGAPLPSDGSNTPYYLSKYFLGDANANPIFYDQLGGNFYSESYGFSTTLSRVNASATSEMPTRDNRLDLLYMGTKSIPSRGSSRGVAIFQSKDDPSIRILSNISYSSTLTITNDTLSTDTKLYHATMYTVLNGDEDLLYFVAADGDVWSYNLANGNERLEFATPSGETVTYIRHKRASLGGSYGYNYVMIGTKQGGNYKLRMFEKSSGSITGNPSIVLEGKGEVKDVYYLAPNVNESTHVMTF